MVPTMHFHAIGNVFYPALDQDHIQRQCNEWTASITGTGLSKIVISVHLSHPQADINSDDIWYVWHKHDFKKWKAARPLLDACHTTFYNLCQWEHHWYNMQHVMHSSS